MRWIWIDRFTEFTSGKSARAVKNLSLAEDFFADHFPGYPVMPGTLILEGLAQAGGILVGEVNDFREKVILAKVPRVVFHREMMAGEQLIYEVEILHLRPEGASVSGRVVVGGPAVGPGPGRLRGQGGEGAHSCFTRTVNARSSRRGRPKRSSP